MSVTARFDPFDRDIALLLDEELSPAAQSAALADFARASLAEADAQNRAATGAPVPHDTFVDGAATGDAGLAQVRADGTILFRFKLIADVLEYIDGLLIAASPVRSGTYARSHLLFADDVETDPLNPAPASVYAFVNAVPYARKIERGLSSMAPDGVYQGVATIAAQRYGNVASVKFSYRSLPSGAVGEWAAKTGLQPRKRRLRGAKRRDWLTRQPAILVTG